MRFHNTPKLAALALGLSLVGSAAIAADHDRDRGRDNDAAQQNDNDNDNDRGDRRRNRQRNEQHQENQQNGPVFTPQQNNNDNNRGSNDDNRWRGQTSNDRGDRDRDWRGNYRRPGQFGSRHDDRRMDWQRFRQNLTSPQRYRLGEYRAPRGYRYRHWSYGQRLPSVYFARDYWLTNFVLFGLFAPPPGLIWVRYGPDALLIDQYTGEIVQVRYNVFYG